MQGGGILNNLFGRVFRSKHAGSRHSDTRFTWAWSLFYLPHLYLGRGREGASVSFRSASGEKPFRSAESRVGWSGGMVWNVEGGYCAGTWWLNG